jgi:hypothetical protein
MLRKIITIYLLVFVTSGCVPIRPATPVALTAMPPAALKLAPAAENAAMVVRQRLVQQLQANFDAVDVTAVEPQDWPNGCLGLPAADELCTEAIVPGYRVTLAAHGETYIYRTDAEAVMIRLESAPAPQIGELLLRWRSQPDERTPPVVAEFGAEGVAWGMIGGVLMQGYFGAPQRQAELAQWAATYASFKADTPAGHVMLQGRGAEEAPPAAQRMVAEWARLAYQEAAAGRSGASWGLAFAWHREGGIAGFCDDLTVYVTGQVYASTCRGSEPQTLAATFLSAEQMAQVYTWVDTLQSFGDDTTDPAVADAITVRMFFSGAGAQAASEAEQQAVKDFAAQLYTQLTR